MKFVTSLAGRAALFSSIEDIRPAIAYHPQALLDAIGERYQFAGRPTIQPNQLVMMLTAGGVAANPPSPLIFQQGTCLIDGSEVQIVQIDMQLGLGTVGVSARTTEETDLILDDLCVFLENEFHFQNIRSKGNIYYGSSVIFEFDNSVEHMIEVVAEVSTLLTETISKQIGYNLKLEFERVGFASDPRLMPVFLSQLVSGFIIERRANHSFDHNRFFSHAPLQTVEHFSLLNRIEQILATGSRKTGRNKRS